jgi:elongation factor Ts
MEFTAQDVKELRERTGAGMMDCKLALKECGGNKEEAVKWLREKGMASAAKKAGRVAAEGAVCSYIHMGGKVGVLAEINCETDFVARGDLFQAFCKDICLQICSAMPLWVRREEVSEAAKQAEMEIYRSRVKEMGKPEKMWDKIAENMLNTWYKEVCLLEQLFVKDPSKTIEDLAKELTGQVGEKIEIRRFVRFERGEGIERRESNLAEDVAAELKKAQEK